MDSDTAEVKIHSRRGLRSKLLVHRDEGGKLSLVGGGGDTGTDTRASQDDDLEAFIGVFPNSADKALRFEDVLALPFVAVDKKWSEKTVRNKLSLAQRAARHPRLENISKTKTALYMRV